MSTRLQRIEEAGSLTRLEPVAGWTAPARDPRDLDAEEHARLATLRRYVALSRVDCGVDLDHMCALISAEKTVSARRYAVAFFRTLARTSTRRLTFHPIPSSRASDDEMWLLRLIHAYRTGDEVSAKALIGFRIRRDGRRLASFLARGLAQTIDALS